MTEDHSHNLLAVCNYVFRLLQKLGFNPKSASFDDLAVFFVRNKRELKNHGKSSGLKILRQFMTLASRHIKDGLIDGYEDQLSIDRWERMDIYDILDELHSKHDHDLQKTKYSNDEGDDDSEGDNDSEEYEEGYLCELRRSMYRQRAYMSQNIRQVMVNEIEPITDEQWEEDDELLDNMIADYRQQQGEEADYFQNRLQQWTAQWWPIKDDGNFPGKLEAVIHKLLMYDDQSGFEICTNFVDAHFLKEHFLDFLLKMRLPCGWLDTPKFRKLPKLNEEEEQKEKKKLFDIFIKPGQQQLLRRALKVIPFDLLPKEKHFFHLLFTEESRDVEAFGNKMLPHFSLQELHEFHEKLGIYCSRALHYKAYANGQEVLIACFDTVAKGCEPLPTFCMYPPNKHIEQQKEELEKYKKTLRNEIRTRILQSKALDLFMLDTEIIDFLSCEEKMLLMWISILKNPDDIPLYSAEVLKRFIKKMDAFERRRMQETICYCMLPNCKVTIAYQKLKESGKSPIWMPCTVMELARRREENIFILSVFNQFDKIIYYDLKDPLYRCQFNKDFKFLFMNRQQVMNGRFKFYNNNSKMFIETKLMAFYTNFVNPEPKTGNTVFKLRDYIDEMEDKIESERSERRKLLETMTDKDDSQVPPPLEKENIPPKISPIPELSDHPSFNDFKAEMREKYPATNGEIPVFFDAPKQLRPRPAAMEDILGLTWRQLKEKREQKEFI